MRFNLAIQALSVLLIFGSHGIAADASVHLDAVRDHLEIILEHGKDRWGKKKTELFVDGIHVDDRRPTVWREKKRNRIISNFASQQVWLRTMVAYSRITGDPRFEEQAEATMRSAFEHLSTPDGLFYWRGHLAFDLERDEAWGMWESGHEFKSHFPWYRGMHGVNPASTQRLMESVWLSHMYDWKTLLFNRHGKVTKPGGKDPKMVPRERWDYPYQADVELPLRPKTPQLSFCNAALSLIDTATTHKNLIQSPELGQWGLRLAKRYWAMRHPETGLGGYQFNVRKQSKSGDKAQAQCEDLLGERAREWLLLRPMGERQVGFPLGLLLCADALEKNDPIRERFIEETVKEWITYHASAYEKDKNLWHAISTDGQRLPYEKMDVPGYFRLSHWSPKSSDGKVLHLAALAHRLRPNAKTLGALVSILEGVGLKAAGQNVRSWKLKERSPASVEPGVIHALLEVDRALPGRGALELATNIADDMLVHNRVNGLFVPDDQRIWASINTTIPLAILHLVAKLKGTEVALPIPFSDRGYLHAKFRGVSSKNWGRTYDTHVFYGRTRSNPTTAKDPATGK